MMDCEQVEELLSDHLEGTLASEEGVALGRHLASCARCAELREALGDVVRALRSLDVPEPARDLADRAASRALATGRAETARRGRPRLRLVRSAPRAAGPRVL